MTREEKQKAINALKISAPVMAVTKEEFNDYIQTRNALINWLEREQEPDTETGHWIKDSPFAKPYCSECGNSCFGLHGFDYVTSPYCPNCGTKMEEEE